MQRLGVSTSVVKSDLRMIKYLTEKFKFSNLFEIGFIDPKYINNLNVIKGKSIGVHSPFIFKLKNHPKLTHSDYHFTFSKILRSAYFAKQIKSEYLIVHYPDALQNDDWNKNLFLLEELSSIIKIRIENTYGNKFFYSEKDYKNLCQDLNLKLCIDIGHLLLDERINPFKFIEFLEEYIEEFHIYYADKKIYKICHHKPWSENKYYIELLKLIMKLDADIVIESTPQCNKDLDKLLKFLGVI
ncbi:sugar phosphate isomerase/epimerase [Thermosipho sp. (in: thermotogales)]|jgi:sugar phosphate isomerase/epimerase|uniref:sugar phosphate isomerase/epimerase n=1 Tax=Thermosipho sp. (in: thermotogales) TaxID=1968895 RepID=UPI00257BA4B7|nr:sugar phosphate isomerase/epimerase [Thermosipho sp. (in: thermotogales)]MBZ4650778.1 endonuclease, family 2 [Thermosipho sp. (in: thermotogales)]